MSELKTPLYESHIKRGGKMVPFAGYLLPVTYKPSSLIIEHQAVRQQAGLFDVSHMGAIFILGKDALLNVNYLLSNDFTKMEIGQVRYTLMLNDTGGVIDDFIVYKYSEEKYMLVVNAANRHKDGEWIKAHLFGDCQMADRSDETAILALQGPNSTEILKKVLKEEDIPMKYYRFNEQVDFQGMRVDISQTGYTGEMGYELYMSSENAVKVWETLLEVGADLGVIPAALGARDTLRLEAGMPLYGHEMTDDISPLETGLKFAVKMQKADFIGKKALEDRGEPTIKRVGLKVTGKGIVRENATIFAGGDEIGYSTSGTHSPTLGYPIAMALIDKEYAELGTALEAEVRGRRIPVEVVSNMFYKREKK
ncbi:glycine cleavage system aminomethyltransferase GcvT [Vagococcus sp. BWB3-3]|uniref:Aminomethyltransferase n=1 Tax=Vagococcus allomyrinae TaxID=2794353 RepID=A0A940PC60_9ENTE|nr:glycine cleavage system aminomethyltransferase GcvT [Vagococcus allomyrinae]MBP1041837.1 glycine cleavage system aminomethyltransferase GcvT [Vagococcus allomyrinae]